MKCRYCNHFMSSKILNRSRGEHEAIVKKCSIKKCRVSLDSDTCEYFDPTLYIYCDLTKKSRLNILNCLQRRFNSKGFESWKACKNCSQFERDLREIILRYYSEGTKILKPPKPESMLKVRRKKKVILKRRRKKIAKKPSVKLKRRRRNLWR